MTSIRMGALLAVLALVALLPSRAAAAPTTLDHDGDLAALAGSGWTTAVAWLGDGGVRVRIGRGATRARMYRITRYADTTDEVQVTVGAAGEVAVTWSDEFAAGSDACDEGTEVVWRVAVLWPGRRGFTSPRRVMRPLCDVELVQPKFTPDGRLHLVWAFDALHWTVVDRRGLHRAGTTRLPESWSEPDLLGIAAQTRRPKLLLWHDRGERDFVRFIDLFGRMRLERPISSRGDFNGGLIPDFADGTLRTFLWDDNSRNVHVLRRVAGRLRHRRLGPVGGLFAEALASDAAGGTAALWRVARISGTSRVMFAWAPPGAPLGPAVTLLRERERSSQSPPAVALGAGGRGVVLARTGSDTGLRIWRIDGGRVLDRRDVPTPHVKDLCDDFCVQQAFVDADGMATVIWEDGRRLRLLRERV